MALKEFECITEALREVKRLVNDDLSFGISDEVFLMPDHYGENFYVTDDDYYIAEYLTKNFYENSADWSPEEWVKAHTIYIYEHTGNKQEFPSIYGMYKNSLINTHVQLIRTKKNPEFELSVDFSI